MKSNKEVIRIILVVIFSLIFTFKITEIYDILSGIIILSLLIFDLFERNHVNTSKSELIYYLSWIIIGLYIFKITKSNIGPFFPIFIILCIKLFNLLIFSFRYKKILVTRTILSKTSLIAIAAYFMELVLNTTHGLASFAVFWAIISSIELLFILLIEKKMIVYKPSILSNFFK